jgi:hemerythrin superfamily protein
VVDFLKEQHRQVRELLEQVRGAPPSQRQEPFDALREMLARHETGEEMVIRPVTRKVPNGEAIAQNLMNEENEAKKVLADLESMDVSSDEFMSSFNAFREDVLKHADEEERDEFPALRNNTDETHLVGLLKSLQRAEKMAPTHPHPSAKTTGMNYVAGPFAAMLDRARDLFSRSSSSES